MSTSYGPLYPGAAANIDRGESYNPWANPEYALSADTSNTATSQGANWISDYLICTGFGFSVPDNHGIVGVQVEVHCAGNTLTLPATLVQEVCDDTIQLYYSSALQGDNLARPTEEWAHTTSAIAWRTFGGESSLWGCALTPAIVNSSGFGVAIAAASMYSNDPGCIAYVDTVRLTVYSAQVSGLWQPEIVGSIGRHIGVLGV